MTPVPPERARAGDVSTPPTDPTLAAAASKPRLTHKDPEQIGPYRILGKIGEGGMGVVYKAEQREPVRRTVALKVIKLGMDTSEVVARFEAERQALALMSHPGVAQVFEAGMTDQGRPFFAMELVPGVPITRYCDDERLSIRQRLELFVPVCQAVQHAHQKGIIHRDLKPSNILVQLIDAKPVPKVIDFGVAKASNQTLTLHTLYTQTGTVVGTPEYMSPEQAATGGLDVDTRTDIYSLGVILYELLTGSLPFKAETLRSAGFDQMARILKESEPPKPSTKLASSPGSADPQTEQLRNIARCRHSEPSALRRELSGDLDWIILKAMEKERARRYETANGLAMDIQRYLAQEPILARPPSTTYRFRKLVRRNRLVFVGVTAFLLALLLGLITSTWQFLREAQARHRAVVAEHEAVVARDEQMHLRREAQAAQARAEIQELAARQRAYASDMNLIQQALSTGNMGRAQSLLERQRPQPGERDLRGWEYRYLWKSCQSDATAILCQQPNEIWSLAVSKDGDLAAVGEAQGGRLSIWNLPDRKLIASPSAGNGYVSAAFSPTDPILAYAVEDRVSPARINLSVILWDTTTHQTLAQFPLGPVPNTGYGVHPAPVFSADGRLLIVFTPPQIFVLEMPSGKKLSACDVTRLDNRSAGQQFAVTHDGSLAAYGAAPGVIRVLDLASGRELWHAATSDSHVNCLAFSPDNKVLATGSGYVTSTIDLWDVASGKPIGQLKGHRAWVSSLVFWPDGKTLASSSADQTIRLWDLSKGLESASSHILRGHRLEVWRLALLPDNHTLISSSKDGSVFIWDTRMSGLDRNRIAIPRVIDWSFAPDSASVVTVDLDGRVVKWHGPELRENQPVIQLGFRPSTTAISPDCRWIAAATDGGVKVWNLQSGTLLFEIESSNPMSPIAFTSRALLVRKGGSIHEWDLATRTEIDSWSLAVGASAGALSPDGRWHLSLGWEGATALHDLLNRTQTDAGPSILQPQDARFSRDARMVAVPSALGFVKLFEFPGWHEAATLSGFLMGVHGVAFSPDGKRLAASSNATEAFKLWDLDSRQELLTLEGQGSRLNPAAFSPDGNALGAVSEQGQLQIWRAPSWAEIEAAEK